MLLVRLLVLFASTFTSSSSSSSSSFFFLCSDSCTRFIKVSRWNFGRASLSGEEQHFPVILAPLEDLCCLVRREVNPCHSFYRKQITSGPPRFPSFPPSPFTCLWCRCSVLGITCAVGHVLLFSVSDMNAKWKIKKMGNNVKTLWKKHKFCSSWRKILRLFLRFFLALSCNRKHISVLSLWNGLSLNLFLYKSNSKETSIECP